MLGIPNASYSGRLYQEKDGNAPVLEWLRELNATNSKAFGKCWAAIARLSLLGYGLRRPEADYVRDGIYEVRVRLSSVNYRLLYFFRERTVCVVAYGLTKEASVAASSIDRSIIRKSLFAANPSVHTFKGESYDA